MRALAVEAELQTSWFVGVLQGEVCLEAALMVTVAHPETENQRTLFVAVKETVLYVMVRDQLSNKGLHATEISFSMFRYTLQSVVVAVVDKMAVSALNSFLVPSFQTSFEVVVAVVQYGAVRPESPTHGCTGRPNDYRGNGQPYGPYFYTAADVREILAYAKDRFITVVPEVEVPGHIRALLAAHPEFACREGLSRTPRTMNGIEDDVLCAGNDEAIRFMEQVYDEVCALFPGRYIHIGGDECPKKRWKACPKCQARMKSLGLKGEDELQAWVTRHFTDYLAKKGRRAIGWDEILAGNPDTETVVHNWRKPEYGIEAAEKGHDVVVSVRSSTYFSLSQGVKEDPFTYLSPKLRCSLATAYSFNPLSGMTEAAKTHVMGAECCMWSECVWNEYDLAFKLWPRACAFAEAVWTGPGTHTFTDFRTRMVRHRERLISQRVNCAPLE